MFFTMILLLFTHVYARCACACNHKNAECDLFADKSIINQRNNAIKYT